MKQATSDLEFRNNRIQDPNAILDDGPHLVTLIQVGVDIEADTIFAFDKLGYHATCSSWGNSPLEGEHQAVVNVVDGEIESWRLV